MPWTIWTIVALIFLALDTIMRYVRLRDDPKAWTPLAAVTGALLWSVAWLVLASSLHASMAIAVVQTVLFGLLYIAVVMLLGARFFAGR